jgi:hypothetical protein
MGIYLKMAMTLLVASLISGVLALVFQEYDYKKTGDVFIFICIGALMSVLICGLLWMWGL